MGALRKTETPLLRLYTPKPLRLVTHDPDDNDGEGLPRETEDDGEE